MGEVASGSSSPPRHGMQQESAPAVVRKGGTGGGGGGSSSPSSSPKRRKGRGDGKGGKGGNNAVSSGMTGEPQTTELLSTRVWDVYSPPPVNSLRGALVPRPLRKLGRRRKISMEVHRVNPLSESQTYEECIIRILEPVTDDARRTAVKRAKEKRVALSKGGRGGSVPDQDDDDGGGDEFDDGSVNVESNTFDNRLDNFATPGDEEDGWNCKYHFSVKSFSIKGTNKNGVMIHIDYGRSGQTREILFDCNEEADDFVTSVEQERQREEERSRAKFEAMSNGLSLSSDPSSITFLLEIVSGWDLPAGDFYTSDPYVRCLLNRKVVHETKFIPKTLDPIWTLKTDSLFLLTVDPRELFLSDGLVLHVMDYDQLGKDEMLGIVTVDPRTLYEADGERMELKLLAPPGTNNAHGAAAVPGYIAVRCRRATDYDKSFMADYTSSEQSVDLIRMKEAVKSAAGASGGSGNLKSLVNRRSKICKEPGPNEGKRVYKIRPNPDPKRVEETTWMTREDLEDECRKDSHHWIDIGSGSLGRLFVEILQCDELPNLDTGGFAGNKTDAFVSLVYEDTTAVTDVVDDTLCPRWMPWTKRAFIFHIFHSSSQLFLGVFDYDESINPADDHDLVGRVSIDITNFHKDTVYVLKYDIFTSAKVTKRKRMGTITVRLRLDIPDERKLLLSAVEPPPPMYVNVKKRKDFRVARYTCTGKYDMDKYDMKVINSYIEEILSLQHVMYNLEDAVMSLLLWRGTMPMMILGAEVKLPIHSATAFFIATYLVERPQLVPSFFFFALGWLMIAILGYRRQMPDPWLSCKDFPELGRALLFGDSQAPPDSIEAYENHEEAKEYTNAWKKRIADAEEAAAKSYQDQLKKQEEYEKEMEEIGEADTDISTKRGGGISVDPFKPILFPIQQNLALVCRYLRHVKHVLYWQECYIAFWVTSGCLLLSFVCLFVPWFFLIKWTARIVVWTLFGPWMKLVDVYYVSQIKPLSEEELSKKKEEEDEKRLVEMNAAASEARIKREDAAKLKAMKKHMFGKFIVKVPILKEDRYLDVPLPESTAVPHRPELQPLSELAMEEAGYRKTRIPGQHLVGDMIPKVESLGFTEAPIGQATAQPKLLDKTGPAAAVKSNPESTAGAYAKLLTIFGIAGIASCIIVPVLSAVTKWAWYGEST